MFMPQHDSPLPITVIDESLIRKALEEDSLSESKTQAAGSGGGLSSLGGGSSGYSGRDGGRGRDAVIAAHPDEQVILEEIETLRLSYRNILKIDNLVGLASIHTLCLDNNVIEEISGIEHLVNLRWLDLSFNNLSEIRGLENLSKLQDLSLFNNNISKIENLNGCLKSLQVLSIGNNNIPKLEGLIYLRQFKSLRLVNLEGNPVCTDPEYRLYVLAHLPKLKYLDYALIDQVDVVSAKEQYQDELLELHDKELLADAQKQSGDTHEALDKKLKSTNLYVVKMLHKEMFNADNESLKFKMLPGLDLINESYEHEFRQQSEAMIAMGLEQFVQAQEEEKNFSAAGNTATSANEAKSIQLIETFQRSLKLLFREARSDLVDRVELQNRVTKLDGDRGKLGDTLLSIEMHQVEQLSALRDTFENRATAIKSARLERAQLFFRAVEDLENSWFTATEDLVGTLLEKMNNNETIDEANEEVMGVLSDKDALLAAVQSSHDIHLGKLLALEDSFRERIIKDYTKTLADTKAHHTQLNRDRVAEVQRLMFEAARELNSVFEEQIADEDDYL